MVFCCVSNDIREGTQGFFYNSHTIAWSNLNIMIFNHYNYIQIAVLGIQVKRKICQIMLNSRKHGPISPCIDP